MATSRLRAHLCPRKCRTMQYTRTYLMRAAVHGTPQSRRMRATLSNMLHMREIMHHTSTIEFSHGPQSRLPSHRAAGGESHQLSINLSRRLMCWMDGIRMPRTALRIPRYVCCAYTNTPSAARCVVCWGSVYTVAKGARKRRFSRTENLGGKKPEI